MINDVFSDIDAVSQLEEDAELDEECPITWNDSKNEFPLLSFGDSQDFEEMESERTVRSEDSVCNSSSFFSYLTIISNRLHVFHKQCTVHLVATNY